MLLPSFLHLLALIWQIVSNLNDPETVQSILYLGSHVAALCKSINFIHKSEVLARIQELLERPTFNAQAERDDNFLYKSNHKMHFLAKSLRIFCYFALTLFGILGFMTSSLPLGGKYCSNQERYFTYILALQMFGIYQLAVCVITIDCVAVMLMQLTSNQFDVLKSNLRHVTHTDDQEVFGVLRTQVKFHNEILEYCDLVEELLNVGIFVQFLSNAPSICFSLLQLILITDLMKRIIVVVYLFCVLNQLGMYCWFGHFVIVKSKEVIDACYMSEWYKCNPKTKVFFFLIMERAKRPTFFTAGKFFKLSLTTFMMILKSSYSYFAVLKQMYDS